MGLEWEKERDRKALSIPPAVWGNSVDREFCLFTVQLMSIPLIQMNWWENSGKPFILFSVCSYVLQDFYNVLSWIGCLMLNFHDVDIFQPVVTDWRWLYMHIDKTTLEVSCVTHVVAFEVTTCKKQCNILSRHILGTTSWWSTAGHCDSTQHLLSSSNSGAWFLLMY